MATLAELRKLIPAGPKYNELGFALQQLNDLFPELMANADAADISRWVADINAGTRTDTSIRNDIFKYWVGAQRIQQTLGVDEATAQALIAGTKKFSEFGAAGSIDADKPGSSVVKVGGTTISQGGRLVRVRNPLGSDAPELFYLIQSWRGVDFAFEIGDLARLNELFGSISVFDDVTTTSQAGFDSGGYVSAGLVDSELGVTESFGSRTEREVAALGMEDLPSWLAGAPDALALIGTATAEEWSSGRLWEELSKTQAFNSRFGTAFDRYRQENVTIADAVSQLVADENTMRAAIRPWLAGQADETTYIQGLLVQGWTPQAASQVLEAAEDLQRRPEQLNQANFILAQSGLASLDEVGFINAMKGHGPQETVEALNTAAAARALTEAGIELDDSDLLEVLRLVDTSDRLLTADNWRELSQQLAFNEIRFGNEIERGKLGIEEDDLIASAFGRESKSGKSSGQVMGLLARFERDRRAASEGYEGSTGYLDDQGRLRIQGLGGV